VIARCAALLLCVAAFAPAAPPARHTVLISQFQFKPAVIHAAVGDTIVWENRDIVPHTARAADGSWDSGDIPGKAQKITIAKKKGTQEFTCLYHSNMKGKLVVK
jgi:plastocyanin